MNKRGNITITVCLLITASLLGWLGFQYRQTEKEVNRLIEHTELQTEFMPVGDIKFVSGRVYKLAGSGIDSDDATITLQSFTEPVSGDELTMSDFGDTGYATIDPGNVTKREFISFTGVSQDGSSDEADLTGVTRGLQFTYPYTSDSDYQQSHSGGAKLIISNAPQLYNKLAVKENDESITGTWTFDNAAIPVYDSHPSFSSDEEIIDKKYADDLAIAGAADANYTTKGLIELATTSEMSGSNATGSTGAYLVIPNELFATTSQSAVRGILSQSDGKIDQSWLALDDDYTWTGEHSISATTTISGDVTLSGTNLTVTASSSMTTTTFDVIPNLPDSDPTSPNQAVRKSYVDDVMATSSGGTLDNTTTEITLFSTTLPGGYLGTNNGLSIEVPLTNLQMDTANDLTFKVKYGSATITSITISGDTNWDSANQGLLKAYIVAQSSTTAQWGFMDLTYERDESGSIVCYKEQDTGTINEDSSNDLTLTVTAQTSAADAYNQVSSRGAIVWMIRD